MANGRRRPVALARRVVAVVLGTVAVFITFFGAGSGSWSVAALGVAVLVLAVSLVVVSAVRGGARAWVAGTAHVVSASEPPASSTYGRCELQVVIDAPGLPAAAVKIIDPRVPVAKWPDSGATLPITVAVDDIRRVRIQWDGVLTHTEAALREEFGEPEVLVEDLNLGEETSIPASPPPAPTRTATVDIDERVVRTEPVAVPIEEAVPAAAGAPPAHAGSEAGRAGTVPRQRKPSPRRIRRPRIPREEGGAPATGPYAPEPTAPADEDAPAERTMHVSDLARSIAFYRDLLRFHVVDSGEDNALLASGGTRLALRMTHEADPVGARTAHLKLEVGDLQTMYDDLRAHGTNFTSAPRVVNKGDRRELWTAELRDPDGHGVTLTEWKNRPTGSPENAAPDV
ncbi:MAG TPA: VOC family protein [Micromonosporaceae bacterium]